MSYSRFLYCWTSVAVFMAMTPLFAGEVDILEGNGDFENPVKCFKSDSNNLMSKIEAGWEFTAGPYAVMPVGWTVNLGIGKVLVKNDDGQENVHSGKYALELAGRNAHLYYGKKRIPPGKYRIEFWHKGEGRVSFLTYNFAQGNHYRGPSPPLVVTDKHADWKKFEVLLEACSHQLGTDFCYLAMVINGASFVDDIKLLQISE